MCKAYLVETWQLAERIVGRTPEESVDSPKVVPGLERSRQIDQLEGGPCPTVQ